MSEDAVPHGQHSTPVSTGPCTRLRCFLNKILVVQYQSRQRQVFCVCTSCVGEFGPQGKKVPAYTRDAHVKKNIRPSSNKKNSAIKVQETARFKALDALGLERPESAMNRGGSAAIAIPLSTSSAVDADLFSGPQSPHAPVSQLTPGPRDASPNAGLVQDLARPSSQRDPDGWEVMTDDVVSSGREAPTIGGDTMIVDEQDISMDVAPGDEGQEYPTQREFEANWGPDEALIDGETDRGPSFDGPRDVRMIDARQPGDDSPHDRIPDSSDLPPIATTPDTEQRVPFDFDAPPPAHDVLVEASPHWFWRILLLLTSWLHVHYHLPHLGCILLLKVCRLLFIALGALSRDDKVPETLTTSFRRLGLSDEFNIHPVCERCHRVFPLGLAAAATCTHCRTLLFKPVKNSKQASAAKEKKRHATPRLQCPQQPLSSSLVRFLWDSDNEKLCDEWRDRVRIPGKKMCIQDGELWGSLPGHDGTPFFDNGPERVGRDELRLGITLGFDGFGYERSQQSGSHSSGVMSMSIANLPTHLKYRPRNLQVYGLTPGPKEFTADELQFFMKNLVDELIRLYEHGIFIKTPLHPEGRRIRVILIAVCCDHPAMCRVCGFGDHRKEEGFCSRCHILHKDLRTEAAMTNGFEPRNGEDHRRNAREYARLADDDDPKAQDTFFKFHSARYFELSRLTYFDPVRMTVFDPMHNILLGIVKTHWYNGWIQTKALRERTKEAKVPRELDRIHEYLQKFEMPNWVARLPQQVGYPAGGSLGADEWKGMATVYCPIVIPFIWDEWYPAAVAENQRKRTTWKKKEEVRLRRIASGTAKDGDDKPDPEPQPRMLHGDDDNFLKLAAALKLIMGRTVWDQDMPHAKRLLHEYLVGFLRMHPDDIKPNHHWVTHIFDQIRDYGPVYGFWTFIFERLNKILKSYSTNNHGGGEIEVSFMRAFMRDAALRQMLSSVEAETLKQVPGDLSTEDECTLAAIQLILASDGDTRGTVASLAQEMDNAAEDLEKRLSLGPYTRRDLSHVEQLEIVEYYQNVHPEVAVVSQTSEGTSHTTNFLTGRAKFHNHIVLDGRRITPSSSLTNAPNSIIQFDMDSVRFVGQVQSIISHRQISVRSESILFRVQWFCPLADAQTSHWDPYPELEVYFWEHGKFASRTANGPPTMIPVTSVISQACRVTIYRSPARIDDDSGDDSELELEGDNSDNSETSASGPSSSRTREVPIWVTIGLTRDVPVL